MTTQPTPGPWVAYGQIDSSGRLFLIRGQHPDGDGSTRVVASGIRANDLPALMAVPDMLAVLRPAADAFQELCAHYAKEGNVHLRELYARRMLAARAAIAKANGESAP